MAIIVKRFKVRYNGTVYGPGQPGGTVVVGLSEEEEARLVAGSNGTIEKYIPLALEAAEPAKEVEEEETPENVTESATEDVKLPEINPDELIKPVKNTENKGKKK